jgi:urease gamma subunit
MFGLETGLQTAMEAGKTDEALALVDSFITIHKVDGEKKQEILSIKFNILMKDNNFEAAEKLLDEIVAVDPESQYGKGAASFKPRLEKMKVEAAEEE